MQVHLALPVRLGVLIQVLDATSVERGAAANNTMDLDQWIKTIIEK